MWADAMLSSPASNKPQRDSTKRTKSGAVIPPSPLVARDLNTDQQSTPRSTARATPRTRERQGHTTPQRSSQRKNRGLEATDLDIDGMPDLPRPSPEHETVAALSTRSKSKEHAKTHPSSRFAPPDIASSPFLTTPPAFDRITLPYSVPSPTKQREDPGIGKITLLQPQVSMLNVRDDDKENVSGKAGVVGESDRKQIDEERRAKAAARIAARRQKREAAQV